MKDKPTEATIRDVKVDVTIELQFRCRKCNAILIFEGVQSDKIGIGKSLSFYVNVHKCRTKRKTPRNQP